MWNKIVKQWLDLAFWWVPGNERSPEQDSAAAASSKAEPTVEPVPEKPVERVPDDLTVIKGIGPAVQEKLRGLDILTFGDLAATDPDALTEKLKGAQPISTAKVRAWTDAARDHARP